MIVLPVRQAERREMRRLGEVAVKGILGTVMDRSGRRLAGRIYGNAAYRKFYNLTGGHGYRKFTPHPSIVGWIAKEMEGAINHVG